MILLLLIFCFVLVLFGVLLDFIAKKKGYRYGSDGEDGKNASESELMKQVHLNQAIGIGDSSNS
jgi:ABC-type Fe3+ transport system permease subunit